VRLRLIDPAAVFDVRTAAPLLLKLAFAHPAPEPDWTDRDAVVEYLVDGERSFAGPDSLDEAYAREVACRVVGRTANLGSSGRRPPA
jgi:hypothetical protein